MKLKSCFIKIILTALFSIAFGNSNSQKLLESRKSSYYTYIYQLTNKEAEKIYKKSVSIVDSTYFHTIIDSFATDKNFTHKLKQGHYLKTYANNNKQYLSITTIQNFEIFILNNNTDLCIQVYNLEGNVISNANIKIGSKNLRYNRQAQCYIDKKSNQKGILEITYNEFTAYYDLSRQYNNSCIKRGTRKIIYGTPLNYVWIPLEYIISLPIDGVKSIMWGYTTGTINRIVRSTNRIIEKIECIFDDYYCEDFSTYDFSEKYKGYMVFNKPKYMPKDTVKFKAFIVTKKGKPLNKSLNVILHNQHKDIKLTHLNPYINGGYEYEFILNDTLQLQLDNDYQIALENDADYEYINGNFEYEDYELTKNKLSLRLNDTEQFNNKEFKIFAKGTDENDLNLLDARIEVLLTPLTTNSYFENHAFMPDTILFLKKHLDPKDETEITISDSIFTKANFDYNIEAKLITSENEVIKECKTIHYFYKSEKINIELLDDSIKFTTTQNGVSIKKKIDVAAMDNFGNNTKILTNTTPFAVKLNPYYSSYNATSDSLYQSVNISPQKSLLQCYSERSTDSLFINVNNPRKIYFSYNIYKKNCQIESGFNDTLHIARRSKSKQDYFLSLRYLWGGKIMNDDYKIPLLERNLKIAVKQPKIVYPGQKTQIEISVTDTEGKPVEDVDLTSYSLTKKFNYSPPTLPSFEKYKKGKSVINNFYLKQTNRSIETSKNLNYTIWKSLAGLDSIEYYKFIYPEKSIYHFNYVTPDSTTQFAPFVVKGGDIQAIHVIYVDNLPVYFSWSTTYKPYSFKIDSGYHQIKIRTTTQKITIDSLYFKQGEKLIFSLDANTPLKHVKFEKFQPELHANEKQILYKYIFPYRNTLDEKFTFLEQDDVIIPLKYLSNKSNNTSFAGPVTGEMKFEQIEGFSSHFWYEAFYEYEFEPGLLKMRSINENRYPKYLNDNEIQKELTDVVLSKKSLYQEWNRYKDSKCNQSPRYQYPTTTSGGFGKIKIELKNNNQNKDLSPNNILILKSNDDQFLRVYPGKATSFHELKEGYYKFIFFYPENKYLIRDSIYVKINGLNYFSLDVPLELKKDSFSLYVSNLIAKTLFAPIPSPTDEEKELKGIYNKYLEQFPYNGNGNTVSGHVYDKTDGTPIPGASIQIVGTTFGAITDIEGYYSIVIPTQQLMLGFSFIGCKYQSIPINNRHNIDVYLEEDIHDLKEVVVVGYGVQKKSLLTGTIATVSSQNLMSNIRDASGNISQTLEGKALGVTITSDNGSPGAAVKIQVRGVSAYSFDKTPLYIINGNVFTGNISDLNPNSIMNIEILKDAASTSIYGARGINGVVIIETVAGKFNPTSNEKNKGAIYDNTYFDAASQASSIRNNFSDYAFWEPKLRTNKDGKVMFNVTFPDDITSWNTYFLAMNGKRQTGQTESRINSYKPLMAQLSLPRFLVESDTTIALGKSLNYSPDSLLITTKFEINNQSQFSKTKYISNSIVDSLQIVAISDSLSIKYLLNKEDGYFDGEERNLAVYPLGLEETKGNFYVLDHDTTMRLSFDPTLGKVQLNAHADIIDVIENELSNTINYLYNCNEQIASKLKALIAEKNIAQFKNTKFNKTKEIEKLIQLLLKNRKEDGMWGWWKESEESEWISLYALEAITQAKNMGISVKIDNQTITEKLVWELGNKTSFDAKIRILKILNLLNAKINYSSYINEMSKNKKLSFYESLQLIEIKQLCNLNYNIESLKENKKTTLFGNVYFADDSQEKSLIANDLQTTLVAYKILKLDTANNSQLKKLIRNYFLECNKTGHWTNTYQSTQIIEAILPDILEIKAHLSQPKLSISGDTTMNISNFPFSIILNPKMNIEISKSGDFPIYFTNYQNLWNQNPKEKKDDFEIYSTFKNCPDQILYAGKETTMIVTVNVKKNAEYVMINIPIPAGCSYTDKKNYFKNESHREYFKNETTIFCQRLSKGEYQFEINLMPRFTGAYMLNPAKIELMYFPTINANNAIKKVRIK